MCAYVLCICVYERVYVRISVYVCFSVCLHTYIYLYIKKALIFAGNRIGQKYSNGLATFVFILTQQY